MEAEQAFASGGKDALPGIATLRHVVRNIHYNDTG
jgi:hypothetical protein